MTIEYLREFLVLAEIKNFSAAADELFMSQASLSRHILAMETELNRKLFQRTSKEVELTDAGIKLLPYARHIVELQDQCRTVLSSKLRELNDNLTLGINRKNDSKTVDSLIAGFRDKYPLINAELKEDSIRNLKNALLSGKCDLIILVGVNFLENEKYSHPEFFSRVLSDGTTDIVILYSRRGKPKTTRQLFISFIETAFC